MPTSPSIPGIPPSALGQLGQLCRNHRVRSIRVFGSAARGELGEGSDLDMLIAFEDGVDPDLLELGGLQQDLSELFEREVDLKTPLMFSPENLRRVVDSSVLAYAA